MSGVIQKALGPLLIAGGAASEYFFPGNPIGMSAIGSGIGQTTGQGGLLSGLLGNNPNIPTTPTPSRNLAAAPMGSPPTPDIPTSAATGISTFVPGAGAGAGTGAGPAADPYAQMIASNMMTNNPFAIYAG